MSLMRVITLPLRRNEPMLRILGARNLVYHRTNKDKKQSLNDYDDGYYYRNGEERYAQKLRNRQADVLRYDDLYYKISRNRRVYNKTHVDFPNCSCAEDLAEYEKARAKLPRPETASPMKDPTRLHHHL